MEINYWSTYNKNLSELSKQILLHNKNNNFNFIEENFYNHVRDILALTIILNQKKKITKILDYGSNFLSWANLNNKINCENLDVTIFDPFSEKSINSKDEIFSKLNIVNNIELIKKNSYDITIFGSSSQYIDDFFDKILTQENILSQIILFTHTPLSLSSQFKSKQLESKENNKKFKNFQGIQIIRSYEDLIEKMKFMGYILEFKSTLNPKFARVEKIYESMTVYANLLFSKKSL